MKVARVKRCPSCAERGWIVGERKTRSRPCPACTLGPIFAAGIIEGQARTLREFGLPKMVELLEEE